MNAQDQNLRSGRPGKSQKDENRSVEAYHILIVESPDARAELCLGDRCELVYHHAARRAQPIPFVWLDKNAEKGCLRGIGREGTNRDRLGCVEAVVLNDHRRARFARVILSTADRPDLAAPHSSLKSETASM